MEEERPGIRYLLLPNPRALPSTQWPNPSSPITVTHFLNFHEIIFLGFWGYTTHTYICTEAGEAIALKLGCRKIKTNKKKFSRWEKFDSYENDSYENHTYHLRGALLIGPFFFFSPMPLSHGSWFMEGVDLNI